MATAHLSSTSVQSPSKSWGCGHELRRLRLPGDVCFITSTSLNTTAVPPPAVGRQSPCITERNHQFFLFFWGGGGGGEKSVFYRSSLPHFSLDTVKCAFRMIPTEQAIFYQIQCAKLAVAQ